MPFGRKIFQWCWMIIIACTRRKFIFYTGQSGLRVFLSSPTISFQRMTGDGNLAPPVAGDDWEIAATDAFIRLGDSSTRISATLTAADFSLRREKKRFYFNLSDTESYGGLRAIAEFETEKTTSEALPVHGSLYLSVPQLPSMPELLGGFIHNGLGSGGRHFVGESW